MSYIKVLFPDGIERGLKFNTLAVKEFTVRVDWDRFFDTANYAMVWGGLIGNAYVKREELELSFEQVCDLCDLMQQDTVDQISTVMTGTQAYKDLDKKISTITDDTIKELAGEKKNE